MYIYNLSNCKCNLSVILPFTSSASQQLFFPHCPNFHGSLRCPCSLLRKSLLPITLTHFRSHFISAHNFCLTGNSGRWQPPLLKLVSHPYFRKKYMGQGMIMLAAYFLLVTPRTVDLMCQPWDNPSPQPWCTKGQESPITQPSPTSHNCHGSEKTHIPCFISLFSLLDWKSWWKSNSRLGWLELCRNLTSEMAWEAMVNKHWLWEKAPLLAATAAAERYRHQKGLWASEEGDMKEAERFRGIFCHSAG